MQILIWLLSLSFISAPPARLTVIDTNLVHPVTEEEDFTVDSYFKRKFPINSVDLKPVIAAAEKASKLLDSKKVFTSDTLLQGGTTFIITSNNDQYKTITVRLITVLEESRISFSFNLLTEEGDRRKAQRKLADFGAYLQQ
ncbi:MAG TPA: hypothetical protein VEY10_15905 [Flavisolibacter sp.]|jgi:hypothetical protein|nr:hypothetical protein [Flavisolibacter sp.]